VIRSVLILVALGACTQRTAGPVVTGDPDAGSGSGSGKDGGVKIVDSMMTACAKMDIVFIVDDSGSMQEEQQNLASNIPMFASVLTSRGIDFHVGISTTGRDISYTIDVGGMSIQQTEVGDNGVFRNNCGPSRRWIERTDADPAGSIACRANVGTAGPSEEMPLLMTKFALADRISDGKNAGFLRSDALLAVVMLTDEDDGSTTKNNFHVDSSGVYPIDWNPIDQLQFLDNLKGGRRNWASAVIAGDGNCTSPFGDAVDAVRLKQFVQMANSTGSTQAVFSSICAGDLALHLQTALDVFQAACSGM
jgi:hypothetical protein